MGIPSCTSTPPTALNTQPPTALTTDPTTALTTDPTTALTTDPTTLLATDPTTALTTEPTTEPTTVPSREPTTAPTTAPSTAPRTERTTSNTTAHTTASIPSPNPVPSLPPNPAQTPPNPTALAPTPVNALATSPNPSSVIVTTSRPTPQGAPVKRKGFRFTSAADLLLLKAVNATGAHLAAWGQREAKFQDALMSFLKAAAPAMLAGRERPSSKTLQDRFKNVIGKRRETVKANTVASGIAEQYGERETLADDLILEMDERTEEELAEKGEKAEKEKRLVEAGEKIRNQALRRRSSSVDVDDATTPAVDQPTGTEAGSGGLRSGGPSSHASPSPSIVRNKRRPAPITIDSDEEETGKYFVIWKCADSQRREGLNWRVRGLK